MNISRNLAFGRREKKIGGSKSFRWHAKMAIRGAKLMFGGGNKIWEYKSFRGATSLFSLFFGGSKNCILCSGQSPFKLVTPLETGL